LVECFGRMVQGRWINPRVISDVDVDADGMLTTGAWPLIEYIVLWLAHLCVSGMRITGLQNLLAVSAWIKKVFQTVCYVIHISELAHLHLCWLRRFCMHSDGQSYACVGLAMQNIDRKLRYTISTLQILIVLNIMLFVQWTTSGTL
jgi:hypothetical protein